MDYEAQKRLHLDNIKIDVEKSYESYNPGNNHHIITIHLLKQDEIICPHCASNKNIVRGSKLHIINYSSILEDNLFIHFHRRIYKCKQCNKYFLEHNPFCDNGRRNSIYKDYKIIQALKELTATYTSVANRFNVSPTYVANIFDRKVDLARLPLSKIICVDEVYSKRLSYHHYCFIIYSPRDRKIIDVLDSRHSDDLGDYFSKIPMEERNSVEFFSTDLYEAYRKIAKKYFPKAKICADPFHVIKNISNCVHAVRIDTMKKYSYLKKENNNYYWLFKSFWKLITRDPSKLSHKKFKIGRSGQYLSQVEIVERMLKISPRLEKTYELYHEYRNFNDAATLDNAKEWLETIIEHFQSSEIEELAPAWKLMMSWHDEIINSFNKVNNIRISNGPMERANRDIKTIFRSSFGSRNFKRMRNRIMFAMNSDSPMLYSPRKKTNKNVGKKRGKYNKHKK